MAETENGAGRQGRSPNFPYVNLTVALQRAQQLYESSRGNPVRLRDAATDWGLSPTSSGTQRVAAALLAFGLLNDEGSGEDRRLRLSQAAMRILDDTRPGVRESHLRDAALRPQVIREYYMKWRNRRPADSHAISQLKFDSGFNDESARIFLRVFDDALSYVPAQDEPSEILEGELKISQPQVEPQAPAQEGTTAPALLTPPSSGAIRGDEWFRAKVGRETTVRIVCDGPFGRQELERLIRLLAAQMEVMDDDF